MKCSLSLRMVLCHKRSLLHYRHQRTGNGQRYYILNRSGPRMDTWGTPIKRPKNELYEEFIFVPFSVSEVAIN